MARIIASGIPEKHPILGEIGIIVTGDDTKISSIEYSSKIDGEWIDDQSIEVLFSSDMKRGPSYPLCADPDTMRCALYVLLEWFGESESCWIEKPKRVKVEGYIEPMESLPNVIY